ncbi:MAG: beta-propeller fold lactonase family protein, partial [Acidobacteriota bacterium]
MAADGRHLYLLSGLFFTGRTLVVLEIDQETGQIQPVQTVDGDLGSGLGTPLRDAWAMALSPGGDRLLVAAGDGLIWVLSIDESGRLDFLRRYDFSNDPDWVRPVVARGLRFDPANGWLYAVSSAGLLRYAWHEGTADLERLGAPARTTDLFPDEATKDLFDFQLSADGRTAFVALQDRFFAAIARLTLGDDGEWTPGPSTRLSLDRMSFAAAPERGLVWVRGEIDEALTFPPIGVRALSVDAAGQFEVVKEIRGRDRAQRSRQAITLSPDGQNLFVPTFENRGVTIFDTPSAAGTAVSAKQEPVSGLRDVRDLILTADGRFIYTAASTENGIGLFERVDDDIVWRAEFLQRNLGSEGVIDAARLYLSPDERFLYLRSQRAQSSVIGARLLTFERNLDTGMLSLLDDFFLDGGTFAFSPDGRHGYMAGSASSRVYARNSATGLLSEIPEAASNESSDHWTFEPGGNLLYSTTSPTFAEAEVYRRDPASGFLRAEEELEFRELSRAFRIEISNDSRFQYFVTSTASVGIGRITVLERDPVRNSHSLVQAVTGLVAPLPLPSEFFYDLALEATGERAFYAGDSGAVRTSVDGLPRSRSNPDRGLRRPVSGSRSIQPTP